MGGAFGNLAQQLFAAVGHVGGVEVGEATVLVAAEVVVEPVFQGEQSLFRVGGDGQEFHDAVLHGLVVEVVAGNPASRAAGGVPAAPVRHVGGAGGANHLPSIHETHTSTTAAVAEIPCKVRRITAHVAVVVGPATPVDLIRKGIDDAGRLSALQCRLAVNRAHVRQLGVVHCRRQRTCHLYGI